MIKDLGDMERGGALFGHVGGDGETKTSRIDYQRAMCSRRDQVCRLRKAPHGAVDPSFWIFGGKPMQQGSLGDTLLHTLQQAAQGSTDGATLRLALRGSLLYPRYLQLISDCRLRLIPHEVFVAQPCAGIRVMAQFQVKHHNSPVLIRASAFGHGPAD